MLNALYFDHRKTIIIEIKYDRCFRISLEINNHIRREC